MGKSKILNFQQLKNVEHAKEMVQDLVLLLIHVHIVVVTVKYDLIRDFSLFNKPVHNVTVMVKKLQTHVVIVMVKEKPKPLRK